MPLSIGKISEVSVANSRFMLQSASDIAHDSASAIGRKRSLSVMLGRQRLVLANASQSRMRAMAIEIILEIPKLGFGAFQGS